MLKTKMKVIIGITGIISATTAFISCSLMPDSSAATCDTSPCNTTFQVNVKETLAVTLSTNTASNTGNTGDFLRNTVNLSVSANNANGFTASMYSRDNTNLVNAADSSKTISTLSSSVQRSSFTNNQWGYSLKNGSYNSKTYGETDAGSNSSYYHPLVSTSANPITILTGTNTANQSIYFGTKVNASQASGTYSGTVVISVVTDTINSTTNPITPTNPATPNATVNTAAFRASPSGGSNGTTTYTYRTGSNPTATTTQVSDGNNVSSYNGYTPPQGVINETDSSRSVENITDGSPLATGFAVTSAVAAVTGITFFILAKRREDDDEEEDEIQQ